MNNNSELKNLFFNLVYLKDISNPKLQKIMKHDNTTINTHLYNAGSLICEQTIIDTESKEILYNYIKENLKED